MDTPILISARAASEIPTKLGLKAGQTIALRYLVRAAAVKSANDAATAIAEGISGSQEAFAERMNRTALAMGMRNTHFVNAHGLTEENHLSTARDMTILGRHMIFDYPAYYSIFSQLEADAGVAKVTHTNRMFLSGYLGADGIKTGYTKAAGYNLVASAERDNERLIATVFGATSSADRTRTVSDLLDRGFTMAPSFVTLAPPTLPVYTGGGEAPDRPIEMPAPGDTQKNDLIASAFSYQDLIARRESILQTFDPIRTVSQPGGGQRTDSIVTQAQRPVRRAPEIVRGRFTRAYVPMPGVGQFMPFPGPPPSTADIMAAATATIAELRQMTGLPSMVVRVADGDAQIFRVPGMGGEYPDRASMNTYGRPGTTLDESIIDPIAPQLGMATGEESVSTKSIFNINEVDTQTVYLLDGGIFDRTPFDMLPTGPLVSPTLAPKTTPDVSEDVVFLAPATQNDDAEDLPATMDQAISFIDDITARAAQSVPSSKIASEIASETGIFVSPDLTIDGPETPPDAADIVTLKTGDTPAAGNESPSSSGVKPILLPW